MLSSELRRRMKGLAGFVDPPFIETPLTHDVCYGRGEAFLPFEVENANLFFARLVPNLAEEASQKHLGDVVLMLRCHADIIADDGIVSRLGFSQCDARLIQVVPVVTVAFRAAPVTFRSISL